MTGTQKRFILIYIIPQMLQIIVVGLYFFFVVFRFVYTETESGVRSRLVQIQSQVEKRIQTAQVYAGMLRQDRLFCDMAIYNDWNALDGDRYINSRKMDDELSRMFYDLDSFCGLVLYPVSGGKYVYSLANSQTSELIKEEWHETVKESNDTVFWFSANDYDTYGLHKKDYLISGQRFITLSEGGFRVDAGEVFLIFELPSDFTSDNDGEVLMFYNSAGTPLYSSTGEEQSGYLESEVKKIGLDDTAMFMLNKEYTLLASAKSQVAGWRFIFVKPMESFWNAILMMMAIMLVLSIFFWAGGNIIFYREGKRLFRSIDEITRVMSKIERNDFDVRIDSNNVKDELKIIGDGINKMSEELGIWFDRSITMEKQKKAEQIRALQYQMNPHFLYNTLASIKMSAIKYNVPNIAENIEILSRLLKNTINKADELITIDEEIANLRDYVALQQFRYKNGICLSIDVDERVRKYGIPNLLIQPIVENAILHGLGERLNTDSDARLEISIRKQGDKIKIDVFDNGVGMSETGAKPLSNGIGLSNVGDRIRLIYGEDCGVYVDSVPNEYTKVTVIIGCKEAESQKNMKGSLSWIKQG